MTAPAPAPAPAAADERVPTLKHEFTIAGLYHQRLTARPDARLTGLRQYKFGPVALDMFGDVAADQLYARAYLSETGEVAWYTVTKVAGNGEAE